MALIRGDGGEGTGGSLLICADPNIPRSTFSADPPCRVPGGSDIDQTLRGRSWVPTSRSGRVTRPPSPHNPGRRYGWSNAVQKVYSRGAGGSRGMREGLPTTGLAKKDIEGGGWRWQREGVGGAERDGGE